MIKLKDFKADDTTKIILSIDCASKLCATGIDYDEAIKFSGVKKKEYGRQKQLFEKLLELTKKLQVNKICAQLELNDVVKTDAVTLLSEYSKRKNFTDDIDSAHCITMAIFQAWKQRKLKGGNPKAKLIELSHLSSSAWKTFESDWNKWIEQDAPLARIAKKQATADQDVEMIGESAI